MKKKKFLLVFAALTVPCTLAAGALVGCGERHEHTYTKWANSETQHWLVCPDDNAKDNNSVADHEFGTDGVCVDCGYVESHTHAYTKWRTSDTEHWKVCPDDNTEGPGTRAPHNYVNGECECGRKDSFSGEVAVGEKFNGKTLTLKKDGQTDVTLTVANGKVTLANMKYGEWTAICDIFGATVKTTVTVDEGMSELDLSGFTSGTAKIDMTTGAYTWHRQSHETAKMNLAEEASGDQYVALKIATASDFLDWAAKLDEMRFGVAMTVNGAEHIINFNWRNWERTNIGFSSDIKNWQTENQDKDMGEVNYRGLDAVRTHLFKPNFQGWDDKEEGWSFGTYGGAIIDGGVYFIYQYEAATGNVKVYLSDGETYILVYTEEGMFETNGKFTAFGITAGETDTKWAGGDWNTGIDREFTFTIGYGTTVNAAVGDEVSEWKSTVNITGNKDEVDGANVVASKAGYSYGETATITITVPEENVATVTVDGGTPVVLEESGDVTISTLNKLQYTVDVVFASDKFSGDVTVDAAYNGKTLTLKKQGQTDLELTVTDGKVTLTEVRLGEWTAICNLLGMNLKTTVTLASGMTSLDLSGFVSGTADMDLTTGAFKWYRQSGKTAKVNLAEEASGDQFIAVNIATASDFLDWANKYDEMRFGVAMTVNGAEHAINFNWRNWQHDQIGFSSDVLNWTAEDGVEDPHNSPKRYRGHDELMTHLFQPKFVDFGNGWDFGTYGGAIIDGGVYFVFQYEAETGDVNVYLSDGTTYMLVYTEEKLFEKNGKLTAFGVVEGDDYNGYAGGEFNSTADREFTFTLGYGATMQAAVGDGVSEWKSTVNITGNKADFEGAEVVTNKTAYGYGESATITVTVPENKIATVTVDDGTPVVLEESGEVTINAINKLQYTVNVVFASDKFTGEVAVDTAYDGKTLTLKKDGQSDINLTVADGKVTLTNVKLGEWTAICNLLGTNIKGSLTLTDGMTELDLSGFNAGTADVNLETGEFVYTSKKDDAPTVGIELAEAKTGDTYVGLKMSTDNPWNDWTVNNFEELHLGVWMTVGETKHWVELHWRNWEGAHFALNSDTAHDNENASTGILKNTLWKPIDGFRFENHCWDEMPFGEAFLGDGIYLIMKYNSATGNVDVLLAKNDGYVKVCTFDKMFAANGEVKAFGVGTIGEDLGYHQTPGGFKIDCVLSVGSSLQDITGSELGVLTNTPVLEVNSAGIQDAAAVMNKTNYEVGEKGTLTVTVPKNSMATVTIGGITQDLYASGEITVSFTVYNELQIGVVFKALDSITKQVEVNSQLNGTNLVLKRAGYDDVTLTVTDGKVSLNNICTGPWDAEFQALGRNVKVECYINEEFEAFPWLGTADLNLQTGEFEYVSVKDNAPTVNVNLVEAETGDTYVGLKMSTDCTLEDLTNKYEELHLGVWMTVGDSKHWVELHWRNWQARSLGIHTDSNHNDGGNGSDTLKDLLWKPTFVGDEGGSSYGDGTHNWELSPFGEAFLGDGIYLIMKYEAATGNVDVLLAKSDGYVKVCTFEKMFAANGEVKAFGVGTTDGSWGFHETPGGFKIDCLLSIGSSLQDITGNALNEWTAPAQTTPEE